MEVLIVGIRSRESVLCLIRTLPAPERRPMPDAYCYTCGLVGTGHDHHYFIEPLPMDEAVTTAVSRLNSDLGLGVAAIRWQPTTVEVAEMVIAQLQRSLDLARQHSRYLRAA